ncbi:hypothetical protein B0I35DRAFT_376352 [Stachybotrys elegans]|uniref:GPI inositol-deacylase n=1 Tax=Stachybotrys elegans TaxID=80388 RepID=A0A8K0SP27_9HYPO|nr:hypothetical protein B0I35DRAFT_376352 [Stachybotrys elegans]
MDTSHSKPISGVFSSAGSSSVAQEATGKLGLTTVYAPADMSPVLADIVLIHGLGGNSRKTWSFSSDPEHFWPGRWLPFDPDFVNTRIHVFGYNADWRDRQHSPLRIYDFAQSLLGVLKNDPAIRKSPAPIIFVGHSMGGCVAKKAYILGRLDPSCKDLVERVHSMFFLGTPHRGADLAPILESILTIVWGKKSFLQDVLSNTDVLAETNDAFRHYVPELRLWSFYETQPVKSKLINRVVVEKASATLGYPNEEIAAMNADHRHLCKFKSLADPNYQLLRNALHTAIDLIRDAKKDLVSGPSGLIARRNTLDEEPPLEDLVRLMEHIGIDDTVDDDLEMLQLLKEPGSCTWLTDSNRFSSWKHGIGPQIMWLLGRPAAGKSVLSSHVVDCLMTSNAYCSYFFFKHGKRGKSTVSDCFLSIACQMAMKDASMRGEILRLLSDRAAWDRANEAIVWRRLFTGAIFKSSSISKHYWVIDGIDECGNFNTFFSKKFLTTLPDRLRVFATSREMEEIGRGLAALGVKAYSHVLSEDDTLQDMHTFLSTRLKELGRYENDNEVEAMCGKILERSRGSFLWVRLVLQDFENAWTDEAMEAALRDVPHDLHNVYLRILNTIEADPRKAKLARSILTWVVTAPRPLAFDEVRCATKLDVNETMQNATKAIPSICGQLVFVDVSGRVQIIHETARRFLLTPGLGSGLAIIEEDAHSRLSILLLRYLSSGVLKPKGKATKFGDRTHFTSTETAASTAALDHNLVAYACQFFAEHVCRSSTKNDELAEILCSFLQHRNILYWIEHSAQKTDIGNITRAAMNLRGYLEQRGKHTSPTNLQNYIIDNWVTDLIRVAAKFRSQLVVCPSSIHCLIPPLCPTESTIFRIFSQEPKLSPLVVKGLPVGGWDDCLARIDFDKGESVALAHGMRLFAVGSSLGIIKIYDSLSMLCIREMEHGERMNILSFSAGDELMVSCGRTRITVWDARNGEAILTIQCVSLVLAATFIGTEGLFLAFQSRQLTKINLKAGESETISWLAGDDGDGITARSAAPQPPSRATFSSFLTDDPVLMALGYRSLPVSVWSPLEVQKLGECGPGNMNGVLDLTFNPNPEISALVVSYASGDLYVYDYTTMQVDAKRPRVFSTCLACSQDGRSLATGSSQGVIEVFEFGLGRSGNVILIPICRVEASPSGIRGVAFSVDGLRVIGLSRRQCQVWEPTALFRGDNRLEGTSEATPQVKTASLAQPKSRITTRLVAMADERILLGGKDDGSVFAFSAAEGSELGALYCHNRGVSIIHLEAAAAKQIVASADNSGRILAARLTLRETAVAGESDSALPTPETILDHRLRAAVTGLMIDRDANRLLISGKDATELWNLSTGQVLQTRNTWDTVGTTPSASNRTTKSKLTIDMKAFQHPTDAALFIMVEGDIARVFKWADFEEITSGEGITLQRPRRIPTESLGTVSYHVGSGMVFEHHAPYLRHRGSLIVWPSVAFDPKSNQAGVPDERLDVASFEAATLVIIAVLEDYKLLFVDNDLWICSTDILGLFPDLTPDPNSKAFRPSRSPSPSGRGAMGFGRRGIGPARAYGFTNDTPKSGYSRRHFFALSEWRDGSNKLNCIMMQNNQATATTRRRGLDFAFVFGERVIIVANGTDFSETVTINISEGTLKQVFKQEISQENNISPTRKKPNDNHWTVVSGSMHQRAVAWP